MSTSLATWGTIGFWDLFDKIGKILIYRVILGRGKGNGNYY